MNTKYKRGILVCLVIVILLLLLYSIQYAGSRAVLGPFHGYGSGVELVVALTVPPLMIMVPPLP